MTPHRHHWVYWRSGIHGVDTIWRTKFDDDHQGYTEEYLHPAGEPRHRPGKPTKYWWWRISETEARQRADNPPRQEATP